MLHIVGGTYLERCVFPQWDEVYGSGLRAAIALSNLSSGIHFSTYSPEELDTHLTSISKTFNFNLHKRASRKKISFHYLHGLSDPHIEPPIATIEKEDAIEITGENILKFGTLEGDVVVTGNKVVYDPQSPAHPILYDANGSKANELVLILNSTEAKFLSKEEKIDNAGRALLSNASVVIIKMGFLGAKVFLKKEIKNIPPYQTESVWPIGSGDIFSATFAHYWAEINEDPFTSAIKASKATALYCERKILPLPKNFDAPSFFNPPKVVHELKKHQKKYDIYLAGPFFTLPEYWLISETRNCLINNGISVFSPIHNVGEGKEKQIAEADLAGLNDSKIIFAILDGNDPGTIFEIGYARANNIPVIIYSTLNMNYHSLMFTGTDCEVYYDFTTAIYKSIWKVMAI